MKRDGASISAWQQYLPDYTSQHNVSPVSQVDIVIAGGGMTGITTALLLQKAGKRCLVAEAQTLGFGTTSGTTAHLNTMLDTTYNVIAENFNETAAKIVANASREAIDLIKVHIKEFNIDCDFKELPGYLFSIDETQSKELQKILEASKEAGIPISYTESLPVPIPFDKATLFPDQAQFHPTKYLQALAKAFESLGGIILENCRVTDVQCKDALTVETSKGIIHCNQLVYATHVPPGVNLLHFRNAPYRSYVIGVKLKNDRYPDAVVYDMNDPYRYYRTHELNGEKILIAGGEDHKTAHEENTDKCYRALEAYVRSHFEVEEVVYRWSSQYFEPTDGLPYIGHLPGNPDHVYTATGYSGNGMIYSHIAALELRSKLLEGKSKYDGLFDPARIKVAGFTNFVKEQTDVVGQLIGKWFSIPKLEVLADLAPDEAKVVKYEGDSIALYKDEIGNLHAVNPACTHIQCSVAWNKSEKSWDCPCHGSRFSYDGQVLTAPARKDLEVINLKKEEA